VNQKTHMIGRRGFLSIGAIGLGATLGNLLWQTGVAYAADLSTPVDQALDPDAALQKLMAGNQRFVQHQPQYPDQTAARLKEVAQSQHPFATILSCADSRVPAEIVFDQGIGDVFDIRIAGNIATPEAIGSIEYAVALLNSPLLMVLGHERCGAVTAAVQGEALPGEIGSFVKAIQPAVKRVKAKPGDAVENAVVANVQYQIEQLQRSSLVTERVQSGKLKLVGGRYDLDTGRVTIVA
jgi:carbonic anhydrase